MIYCVCKAVIQFRKSCFCFVLFWIYFLFWSFYCIQKDNDKLTSSRCRWMQKLLCFRVAWSKGRRYLQNNSLPQALTSHTQWICLIQPIRVYLKQSKPPCSLYERCGEPQPPPLQPNNVIYQTALTANAGIGLCVYVCTELLATVWKCTLTSHEQLVSPTALGRQDLKRSLGPITGFLFHRQTVYLFFP